MSTDAVVVVVVAAAAAATVLTIMIRSCWNVCDTTLTWAVSLIFRPV